MWVGWSEVKASLYIHSLLSFNYLQIDQPALGLPDRDYFLRGREDRKLKAYEKYARDMAIIFGADPTTAAADMSRVVDFEIKLANVLFFPLV